MAKNLYQEKLDLILTQLDGRQKPSLMLHACCGPCSSYVLEYLSAFFEITVLYYNPNIFPKEEYARRLNELKKFYTEFPPALENKIKVIELDYNPQEFYDAIKINEQPSLADEKEKGVRCYRCYKFRLQKTLEYALKYKSDYFCTTLSISPFKDAKMINEIGEEISKEYSQKGIQIFWLPSDFKKKNGFKRSLELSEKYGLYRQKYCGCVYSKNQNENNNVSISRNNQI